MFDGSMVDYGRIKVGVKSLEDTVLELSSVKKGEQNYYSKGQVLKALADKDISTLREISEYFYRSNGIYKAVCNYYAYLYRYDWWIVPEINSDKVSEEKILATFGKILSYLDSSSVKAKCGEIALKVIRQGAYYGYFIKEADVLTIQELPPAYCRSRYSIGNQAAIEFNMKFFDDKFSDINYRMKVLKMFPPEFAKGYLLYKQGKLKDDAVNKTSGGGWYLLDPSVTFKFSLDTGDIPYFVNAIPALIDLDAAQELDRRKQMQKLLKILVQKLPRDKNGDLIFDNDEAKDIHNNAVQMLRNTVGTDILTTFADIEAINLADNNATAATDDLTRAERTAYNAIGTSQNLFNSTGNLSLEKSVNTDETAMKNILYQLVEFFNKVIGAKFTSNKQVKYRLYMLETSQNNYKDLSKMYKEHVSMGYSKVLPQIALGHSQNAIINAAHFENEVLHLSEIMIPNLTSNSINGEDILNKGKNNQDPNKNTSDTGGRPQKEEGEKSDKTLANLESMN